VLPLSSLSAPSAISLSSSHGYGTRQFDLQGERSMQISSSLESAAARLARTTIGLDGKAEDRGAEWGDFMRLPSAQLRCVLTKRKFEEVECSVAESNGLNGSKTEEGT